MYQYPKQILTIEQQVQFYVDAGMEITSREAVEKELKSIGFYRLRGYSFHFEEWTVFVDAFDKLIQNNNGVVSLTAMNLPADWKAHLSV